MAWLISVLGAILALSGGYSLWNGIAYIRLDWGQTETVAGTIALSGGIVTLAIGAVLFALRDLARRQDPRPSGVGMEALTWSEDDAPVSRPMIGRVKARLATVGLPRTRREAPEGETPAPVAARAEPAAARAEPAAAEPRPRSAPVAEPAPPSMAAAGAPRPVYDEDVEDPSPTMAEAPTVVGRYEANGASYVLFSDGTIEVETEHGTHRFASMADLKEHIERQEAG